MRSIIPLHSFWLPLGTAALLFCGPHDAWGSSTAYEASPSLEEGGGPANDECADATVNALSVPGSVFLNGSNAGATNSEGAAFPLVWEAFTIPVCATVRVSFCAMQGSWNGALPFMATNCPYDPDSIAVATDLNMPSCGLELDQLWVP
ncbi:MAG: hypothetical protein IPK99_11685 [Flavobacteriales bacterium]|nr:hypothetical protein [Flavobacteriales bacterium]